MEVTLGKRMLTLKGERKEEKEEEEKSATVPAPLWLVRARALPCEVAAEKVAAQFSDGVLTVTLPKAPEAKESPGRIAIS